MNIHQVILIFHIICGFTALTIGVVPMIVKKGGRLHRLTGKIYAWAMYGISVSTFGLFLLNPGKPFLQFLLCIAVLGFYFTFTGVRSITLNRNPAQSRFVDKLVAWFTLSTSCIMFIYGSVILINTIINRGNLFLGILYTVFGFAMATAARADLKSLFSKNKPQLMQWFFNHFIRILSAYIATFTAFCVVNVRFLPPLIVWTLPGVIGGTVITLLAVKYTKKFNKDKTGDSTILELEPTL